MWTWPRVRRWLLHFLAISCRQRRLPISLRTIVPWTCSSNVALSRRSGPQLRWGLTIGNSASTFNGTILATGSTINWQANDLNGQLIASNLIDKSAHEYHNVPFFASDVNCPIPEPYTYAL